MFSRKSKKHKLGLALSGGGARGFSHLGSAKALIEAGYQYNIISGTSMGAIIGCVLADGYSPEEILEMITKTDLKSFVNPHISSNSFMSMKGARDILERILRSKNIEDLKIPFIAVATDIRKGEIHYFTNGNIIDAVIASASIPVVYEPTIIDGSVYVDGGVLNNLPVRCIRENCEKVVAFHVNPLGLGLKKGDVKGIPQIAERTFFLGMRGNILEDKKLCDIFIEHDNLENYSTFDFIKMKEIYNVGYENTKKILSSLQQS